MAILNRLAPIVADGVGVALFLLAGPVWVAQFSEVSATSSFLMGGLYVLFLVGVYVTKRLQGSGVLLAQVWSNRPVRISIGVLMALFLFVSVSDMVGIIQLLTTLDNTLLDETGAAIYLLVTPATWFGIGMVYVLILLSDTQPTVADDSPRFALTSFVSLGLANVYLVGMTAYWRSALERTDFAPIVAILMLVSLVVLYLPPRLLYVWRTGRFLSLISFIILLIYLAVMTLTP